MGYDEKLADETAEAMANGETEKVFANQKKHLEAVEKRGLEAVLRQKDSVLLLGVTNLNGLAVANAHRQLLRTISGLVDIDFTEHTSRTHQRIVNAKQKEQEEREELQSKYDKLLHENQVSKFKANLLAMGYDEKLADTIFAFLSLL